MKSTYSVYNALYFHYENINVCVCERVFTAPRDMKFLDPPLNIEGDMDGLIIYIDRKLAVDYKGN